MRIRFPLTEIGNIRLYYGLAVVNGASFIIGNWLFFWLRFMTYGELGLVDGIVFGFGLLMGIPTGAVADLIGKKKTLIAAMLLASFGILSLSLSSAVLPIFVFFLLWQLGMALYSGAAEALVYDTLVENGQEQHFDRVISTNSMISIITLTIASLIGIWMYELHFRLPHIAWGLTYGVGFILTLYLVEPEVTATEKFTWGGYLHKLREGTVHLFQPALKRYLPMIFTISGIYFLYSNGFFRPAIALEFGFEHEAQSVILAILGLIAAVIMRMIPWLRTRISDGQGLFILSMMIGAGFLASAFPIGHYGFFALLIIGVAGRLTQPWVSVVVNQYLESEYRATALSVVTITTQIPYTIVAIAAGQIVEQGHLADFNLGIAVVIFSVTGLSVLGAGVTSLRERERDEA
jgi:MFS family permease